MPRPTSIDIDLGALARNQSVVQHYAPHSKMVCCVKADAYGHGLLDVASVLAAGADALAVASLDEAVGLREAGFNTPILLLEGVFRQSELSAVVSNRLWMVVHNEQQLDYLKNFASPAAAFNIWLKVDTGMHRLGFHPDQVGEVYDSLRSMAHVGNVQLMTHFACADELSNSFTEKQIEAFNRVTCKFDAECSLANSAGILGWADSHRDWVRPGFMLYGQSPFGQQHRSARELEAVMSFETEVIDIKKVDAGEGIGYNHCYRLERDAIIAILAVGYGDGYPRNTKNGAPVLINGQRAKTVGRVAMDMLMVDISDLNSVKIGAQVELWGKHLSVNEVAAFSGYSPYELLTRIPPRVKRNFVR